MQRTSEKPDTLRSEKRERDWLKKGKKHGDFSSGEGLDALKQAQQIAKEEQAKNLRTAAVSEKKAKSLAIAAASVTTGSWLVTRSSPEGSVRGSNVLAQAL